MVCGCSDCGRKSHIEPLGSVYRANGCAVHIVGKWVSKEGRNRPDGIASNWRLMLWKMVVVPDFRQ